MIKLLKKLFSRKPREEELILLPPSEMGLDKHEDRGISEWFRQFSRYWEAGEVILETSNSSLDRTIWFRIWTDAAKKNGVWVHFSGYVSKTEISLKIYNIVDGWQKEEIKLGIKKETMPNLFESYEGLLKAMLGIDETGKSHVKDAVSRKVLEKLKHGKEKHGKD